MEAWLEAEMKKAASLDRHDDGAGDKDWAHNYILGPLHDLEPNQVSATRIKTKPLPPTPPSASVPRRTISFSSRQPYRRSSVKENKNNKDPEHQPLLQRVLSRSSSVNHNNNNSYPPPPPKKDYPPPSNLERKKSLHTANPPQTRWNQGTVLSRANSVASSRPTLKEPAASHHRRTSFLAERYPGDRSHRPLEMLTQDHMAKERDNSLPRRGGSLRERYPGDMSHRPLAMLKNEHRAADRAPHLHNHKRQQPSDPIDLLDHTGPVPDVTYHHGGPFDATMKSRNVNKKYSPVEAVKDSNIEAIKATPSAYVQDSLVKHVPLQGTAVVPPGHQDMTGRMMDYQEGADLMRERDAAGGAYKRWDHVPYLDEDLKGKGEPSYTIEKDHKERKARMRQQQQQLGDGGMVYEMQPQRADGHATGLENDDKHNGTRVRQRSASNAGPSAGSRYQDYDYTGLGGESSGLRRSNTTGKSIAQSLKRRFGSLRKKRIAAEDGGY